MPESQSPGIQASQVKALETEVALLKAEAVARLDAERVAKEANAEVVARLNAEKEGGGSRPAQGPARGEGRGSQEAYSGHRREQQQCEPSSKAPPCR